ncbi:hypothetical protein NDU88_010303 [Pleurodeles waltl]|uniref:Uncharacterized protein n=1 Tax=Pleurodeles waltl TaxID=8319 RepID=A0AAV7QU47_PLEWA|nr:hypothetical protein NDU88_010303 [Pleurodeles waltl]
MSVRALRWALSPERDGSERAQREAGICQPRDEETAAQIKRKLAAAGTKGRCSSWESTGNYRCLTLVPNKQASAAGKAGSTPEACVPQRDSLDF